MHVKWPCGYLGVPVATNVASEEILLDTAALDGREFMFPKSDNKEKIDTFGEKMIFTAFLFAISPDFH